MKLPRIIYAIQHNVTKRIYVGSSANVENRYWNHMNNLRNHKHNIEDMQSDYDNYGEDYSLYLLVAVKNLQSIIQKRLLKASRSGKQTMRKSRLRRNLFTLSELLKTRNAYMRKKWSKNQKMKHRKEC